MSKLKNVWVITDKPSAYAELCAGARTLGESVTLCYAGERDKAAGADRAVYLGVIDSAHRWSMYVPAVAELVRAAAPELVLLGCTPNCRLTAGVLAAALGTSVLTDSSDISVENGVTGCRMVYGGAAVRTERAIGSTAVVCAANGAFSADGNAKAVDITDANAVCAAPGVRCMGVTAHESSGVNLSAAKRIVGVGRGLGEESELGSVRALAAALGAEVGCTRPIAEESRWLPRESYIGVSGVIVKPEIYVAVGLSGQVQHTVGIDRTGTIVAINKDENAPIFKVCDYGIVGDLKAIVPQLTALIEANK